MPLPGVPKELGELSREHAEAVRQLSQLDEERLVPALAAGHIRFVRSEWLLNLPPGSRIQRRQELEKLDGSPSSPLLSCKEAVAAVRRGDRALGALTYGWVTPGTLEGSLKVLVCAKAQSNGYLVSHDALVRLAH